MRPDGHIVFSATIVAVIHSPIVALSGGRTAPAPIASLVASPFPSSAASSTAAVAACTAPPDINPVGISHLLRDHTCGPIRVLSSRNTAASLAMVAEMHIREGTFIVTQLDHGDLSVFGSHSVVGALNGGSFPGDLHVALKGVIGWSRSRGAGRSWQSVLINAGDDMGGSAVGIVAATRIAAGFDAGLARRRWDAESGRDSVVVVAAAIRTSAPALAFSVPLSISVSLSLAVTRWLLLGWIAGLVAVVSPVRIVAAIRVRATTTLAARFVSSSVVVSPVVARFGVAGIRTRAFVSTASIGMSCHCR